LGRVLEEQKKYSEAVEVYKKYMVYLNDALKKEEIQRRIDQLENPQGAQSGASTSTSPAQRQDKGEIDKLRNELRDQEGSTGKRIDVDGASERVLGDFGNLTEDEDTVGLDLKQAAKKRATTTTKKK
jgi:hypothetical protein